MTNPGDSDEWWKQYSGEGIKPDASNPSVPQPPAAGYSSAPQYQAPPVMPQPQSQYPSYPPPQPDPAASAFPPPAPAPAYGYQSGGQPMPGYQSGGQPMPGYQSGPGYQPYGYAQPTAGANGLAIASLVVSILGAVTVFFCGFIPVLPIVGLILGVVALNQVKQTRQEGRGLALGGIWVGAAGVVIAAAFWLILLISVGVGN
ncbi:DUF4190 domain-containing protein [Nocardia sp. NPDC050406]|uniref:DUF4190 domain-containing protein n=1 Tax=Nocardia sp. NPDC050406 TaxID=3364318 RepID=UPI00378EC728